MIDTITPAFLNLYKCAWLFPFDAAHFAGEHDDEPHPECFKCRARSVQTRLAV